MPTRLIMWKIGVWPGARLSDYQDALLTALERQETPVAIELQDDLPPELFDRSRMVVVDHHGERAGMDQPTSIEQIFRLLGLSPDEWTRRLTLVAANDKAHVAGLIAAGATPEEIAIIRADDRAAQGVTEADEAEAIRAIAARTLHGRLTFVETAGTTSSAIADRMLPEMGGPGYQRLLVRMPAEVAVFGDGASIADLARTFPNGWWGGDLPRAGFWGRAWPPGCQRRLSELIDRLR